MTDYDWWLDRELYRYDKEREQDDYQQQLEQQEYELDQVQADDE
jgi:hypothetical protein